MLFAICRLDDTAFSTSDGQITNQVLNLDISNDFSIEVNLQFNLDSELITKKGIRKETIESLPSKFDSLIIIGDIVNGMFMDDHIYIYTDLSFVDVIEYIR